MPYEVFVDVESEEDLYELLATGQLSQASFDALLFLHQSRVDLNQADRARLYLLPNLDYEAVDRIIAHRQEAGSIGDVQELVEAGVLGSAVADSLLAFVVIGGSSEARAGIDAMVRIQGRWSGRYDRLPPPVGAQARIRALGRLDMGAAATLTRNHLSRARWDASRDALVTKPESTRFEVPKLYVHWQSDAWEVIAGTYRVGFGQRLTFDLTGQVTPNGFFGDYELRRGNDLTRRCKRTAAEQGVNPCSSDVTPYVTPDFEWTNRLTGAAIGLKHVSMGKGWLELYAWGSYQIHRVSQVGVFSATDCADPRIDEDPSCGAPPVLVQSGGSAAPAAARFASLRQAYAEALGGGRARYAWSARKYLGLTGFGSAPRWLVRGAHLDFQEFLSKPFGGPFGALGLDAGFGFGSQDFSFEIARSFDHQKGGGGGFGAVVRSVTTLAKAELDVSARCYGARYANPYARPIAAPDELDGLRARDEAGLRLRTTTWFGERASLRAFIDVWRRLSSPVVHAAAFVRADVDLGRSWSGAVWVDYRQGGGERLTWTAALG
ncbi:MAG: helix-hairpin-helix domain-containing protein, partial [Myxococcales bacterium]